MTYWSDADVRSILVGWAWQPGPIIHVFPQQHSFFLSASVLILEIALTRVFSFVLWYHLTYLVVGLALLGYGAAGSELSTGKSLEAADYCRTIARNCVLCSVLTVVAVAVALRLPRDADGVFNGDYRQIALMGLTHLVLASPFFFAGTAIGFVLMRNGDKTNRLYSADLLGAGAGSLLSVLLIDRWGAVSAIFVAAAIAACVALASLWKDRLALRVATFGLALLFMAGAVASTRYELLPVQVSGSKELAGRESRIAFTGWNILNRIDVMRPARERFDFGGRLSYTYSGEFPVVRVIYQDATAPTALVNFDGQPRDFRLLGYFLQGVPYAVRNNPGSVLVIGFGGGIDGLIAEHAGAKRIVGVDINPITVDVVSRRYRDFAGGLFRQENVSLVVSEGRHYLTQSKEQFDVIQLSGVDTFAALSSGAFALSENYLYTEEAIRSLVDHLKEDGVLSYSRWLFTPPRESLKLVVTASEALRQMGVQDTRTRFFIVSGGPPEYRWADTLVKKNPFSVEEISQLRAWAKERGFQVVFDPSRAAGRDEFSSYLNGSELERRNFVDSYLYDVSASRDDKPFFFQFYRWRNIWEPLATRGYAGYVPGEMPKGLLSVVFALVEMSLFSVVFVLAPFLGKRKVGLPLQENLPWLVSFAALGLGFITVEMILMQKLSVFLGGPAYSMVVTLTALLISSGLGSRWSKRISNSQGTLGVLIGALVLTQALELAFLNWGVPNLLGLGHEWRCVAGILAISPLGLLMGMPFPALLARAGNVSAGLIPWAWGVNACATVIGSVLSTMASMTLGFNFTWILAMGAYLLVVAMTTQLPKAPSVSVA